MAQSAYSLAVSQGQSGVGLQGAPTGPADWRGRQGQNLQSRNPGMSPYGTKKVFNPNTGGWEVPPPGAPNPGDFDQYGNRWMPATGKFEPPNMFSDLNPEYGAGMAYGGYPGGGGGGGGGGVHTAPAVVSPPVVAPPGGISPMTPGQFDYLYLPENLAGAIPEQYRAQFGQVTNDWLRGLGYTGLGDVGRYGERKYAPPPGAANPYFLAPSLFGAIADPTMRSWLNYVLGEYGLTTRIPMPVVAPPAA